MKQPGLFDVEERLSRLSDLGDQSEFGAGTGLFRREQGQASAQTSQTGLFIRAVGITRASMRIGLANIIDNMRCFLFLERMIAAA